MKARRPVLATSLTALLLLLLSNREIAGFNREIHWFTQAALGIASDWPLADALLIAAANDAVDRNKTTKPRLQIGLELTLTRIDPKLGLGKEDYYFHCFSQTDDAAAAHLDDRNQDVKDRLKDLKAAAADALRAAKDAANNLSVDRERRRFEALVAVGVYYHCQQDSWSHSGYGNYRFGHLWDNGIRRSPDDPGRRPTKTENALRESLADLHDFSQLWMGDKSPNDRNLAQLLAGLTDQMLLPVSRSLRPTLVNIRSPQDCLSDIALYWLYEDLTATNRIDGLNSVQLAARDTCGKVYGKIFPRDPARARVIVFDPAQYPQLDNYGKPTFDQNRPILITAGRFDEEVTEISAQYRSSASTCSYFLSVTVRNSGPGPAPAAKLAMALLRDNRSASWFAQQEVASLTQGQSVRLPATVTTNRQCAGQTVFVAEIQPGDDSALAEWDDRNASNDLLTIEATRAPPLPQ